MQEIEYSDIHIHELGGLARCTQYGVYVAVTKVECKAPHHPNIEKFLYLK